MAKRKKLQAVDKFIIHCSATPPSMDIGARKIDLWHRRQGWNGIGYHFVIKRDGVVETGRPLNEPGAHVYGHNFDSTGICLIGGINEETAEPEFNYTKAQMNALYALLRYLPSALTAAGVDASQATVYGHRDFTDKKACPSFDARAWWTGDPGWQA